MSEYKGIKGFQVTTRTEDPVPYAQALADNPYSLQWSSGGNLNTARGNIAGVGTQTAALGFGGNQPGNPKSTANEQYNGSSWTELGDLNTGRGAMYGFGTTTAAIGSGGLVYPFNPSAFATNLTESWNGSAWTETSDMTYGRSSGGSATSGTSTAGLIFGGGYLTPSPNYALVAYTESWDGSGWTETADLNSARGYVMGGAGTQTSALAFGGNIPPSPSTTLIATESWNGSSWTEVNDLNTSREGLTGAGSSNTNAIAVGGNTPAPALTGATETWDGTSWTEGNDLALVRSSVGTAGTSTAALAFGGVTPPYTTSTEEWAFGGLPPSTPAADYADAIVGDFYYNSTTGQFKTVNDGGAPLGTWASGGSLNTARGFGSSFGTQTAAIYAAGYTGTNSPAVENYNGTSWTEVAEVNTVRRELFGFGTASAGLKIGGRPPRVANVEEWDGSSWTEVNDLNTARSDGMSSWGTLTSGLLATGAADPGAVANVESWNGTSWTETTDVNTARNYAMGLGTSSGDGLVIGGDPDRAIVEQYDGSSWTEITDINTARQHGASSGTATLGIIFAGYDPDGKTETEFWNGSSWSEVADLATARYGLGGSSNGTSNLALGFGGYPGPKNNTEEWTAVDFQIKTVTTS